MKTVCSICLEDEYEKKLLKVKCGHLFHHKCLFNWIIQDRKQKKLLEYYEDVVPLTGKCPLCRVTLKQIFDFNDFDENRIIQLKSKRVTIFKRIYKF